jgi:vanillate monooxygenase
MTQFLRNQWYVAAQSTEIEAKPFARRVLGEPLVLFRRGDGVVAALEDRCPHRKAPLSAGVVLGDEIQCAYHGARFRSDGSCALFPSHPSGPGRGFVARSYPVLERHALVFVWMGEAARADPALLPDWSANTAPGWKAVHGYRHIRGHYQLVVDNLLDLTHLPFVHKATLAQPGMVEAPTKVEVRGNEVHTLRVMRGVDPAPIHRVVRKFEGKVDRWQTSDFRPPAYIGITLGLRPAAPGELRMDEVSHMVINSITPESETSAHYFWSLTRRFALEDEEVSRQFREMTGAAFEEDAVLIEAQQRNIESDASGRPLASFREDQAGVAARRVIARLLEEESHRAAA